MNLHRLTHAPERAGPRMPPPGADRSGSIRPACPGLAARSFASLLVLAAGTAALASEVTSSSGPRPAPARAAGQVVERPKVALPSAPVKLLPFDVRLRRIAVAVNVQVSDPVFDAAREQRLALGAHDFANGTAPDLQWNSQRMATWIAVMLPVCRDTRVRSNLGNWNQGSVEKFVQSAFGRASTAGDLEDLSAALAVSGDDGWVATCLSLVSSAEVLLQ